MKVGIEKEEKKELIWIQGRMGVGWMKEVQNGEAERMRKSIIRKKKSGG